MFIEASLRKRVARLISQPGPDWFHGQGRLLVYIRARAEVVLWPVPANALHLVWFQPASRQYQKIQILELHCTSLQHHGWMTLGNSCSFIHVKVGSRQDWFSSYVWIISTHRLTLDGRSHCQHSLERLKLIITSSYFSSPAALESRNSNQGRISHSSQGHLDEVASLQVALRLPEVESRGGWSQPELFSLFGIKSTFILILGGWFYTKQGKNFNC